MIERKTENLLEQAFRKAGFQDADFSFQGSLEAEVQRLLPSKRGGVEGKGRPEHLIRLNGDAADILVTECKASKTDESPLQPTKFAEDGVIHYMRGLRREFNVIGVAVSGMETPEALRITTFKALRGGKIERVTPTKIIKRSDYQRLLRESDGYGQKEEAEIITFTRDLHDCLRDHMELSEAYKPLIVSGILLGLKDNAFERSYRDVADSDDLAEHLHQAIKRSLKKAKVKNSKFDAMMANYHFIKTNISVKKYLREAIGQIYRHLFFALLPDSSFDLLGSFYGEFLRYSGGDQQGLGIVLTPRHMTELFADIADLDPSKSVVLDTCAGTGGFLIAAMAAMIAKAANDSRLIEEVKERRLAGIELDPHMFTLACANMIFRGDGKANMFWDDCLSLRESETARRLDELAPNVVLLNPPFSKKAKGKDELAFVKKALDYLQPNGIGVVFLPIGALIDDGAATLNAKRELLERHTLTAVMSMPPQLFPGVGTVTAIAVFEAHRPHHRPGKRVDTPTPRKETWFGYWRDDGFISRKNKRIERRRGIWEQTKAEWLDSFFNQRVIKGKSCKVAVSYAEEWVAEAYLEADYSQLTREAFEAELKRHIMFRFALEAHVGFEVEDEDD